MPMNQLLVRAASNLSLVNISKGRSNRGGVGSIVTRKQNGLSGIGMAVSTGILEESASCTDTNGYQSGEAIYRTLVPVQGAWPRYRVQAAGAGHSTSYSSRQPCGRKGNWLILFHRSQAVFRGIAGPIPLHKATGRDY